MNVSIKNKFLVIIIGMFIPLFFNACSGPTSNKDHVDLGSEIGRENSGNAEGYEGKRGLFEFLNESYGDDEDLDVFHIPYSENDLMGYLVFSSIGKPILALLDSKGDVQLWQPLPMRRPHLDGKSPGENHLANAKSSGIQLPILFSDQNLNFNPGSIMFLGGEPQSPYHDLISVFNISDNPDWEITERSQLEHQNSPLVVMPDSKVAAFHLATSSVELIDTRDQFSTEVIQTSVSQTTESQLATELNVEYPEFVEFVLPHLGERMLPDGRALFQNENSDLFVYTPDYFNAPDRITIDLYNPEQEINNWYPIKTSDDSKIKEFVAVKITGPLDPMLRDQRIYQVYHTVDESSGHMFIYSAPDKFIAPPGYYYLHAVTEQGEVSKGKIFVLSEPEVVDPVDETVSNEASPDKGLVTDEAGNVDPKNQ